jgi:hypothetical protein
MRACICCQTPESNATVLGPSSVCAACIHRVHYVEYTGTPIVRVHFHNGDIVEVVY